MEHAIGALLVGSAAFLVVFLILRNFAKFKDVSGLEELVERRFFGELRMTLTVESLMGEVLGYAALLAIGVFVATGSVLASFLVAPLALLAPVLKYSAEKKRRREMFNLSLPAALQQVANYVSGGKSLEMAIRAAAESAPWPVNEEFELIARRAGPHGIVDAMEHAKKRLNSKYFDLAVSVIKVGSGPGGDIVQALKGLSITFVELERLAQKMRTATAQARRSMMVMSIVPVVLVVAAFLYQRRYVEIVIENYVGIFIVIIAFAAWLAGILWARKLMDQDV